SSIDAGKIPGAKLGNGISGIHMAVVFQHCLFIVLLFSIYVKSDDVLLCFRFLLFKILGEHAKQTFAFL
ncbi:hypothetical protein M1506_00875, partial [Patescibacteria group bacterium]|nr:hypothetical protein [Patescibacteria group bacterium]